MTRAKRGGPRATSAEMVVAAPSKPDQSRAREDHAEHAKAVGLVDRTDRVRYVEELMVHGRWETGVTNLELVAVWGVSEGTLDHYASEASRWIKRLVEIEPMRELLLASAAKALDGAKPRDVAALISAMAPILGLRRDRLEMSGPDGKPVQAAMGVIVLPAVSEPAGEPPAGGG